MDNHPIHQGRLVDAQSSHCIILLIVNHQTILTHEAAPIYAIFPLPFENRAHVLAVISPLFTTRFPFVTSNASVGVDVPIPTSPTVVIFPLLPSR